MIKRIVIQDYQSLGSVALNDLGSLNLVVGRNASGKSAVLRALTALATNQRGWEFIKKPRTTPAHVSMLLDDGTEIGWTKHKEGGGAYTLGERTFTKTAGQVPEEIAEVLGIRPLDIDDSIQLLPQIQRQADMYFLIGESGSRVARILGSLTKLDRIVSAQMACRKKRDQNAREAETAGAEQERLDTQLAALPDTEDLRDTLSLISQALTRIEEVAGAIEKGRALVRERSRLERVLALELSPLREKLESSQTLLARLERAEALVSEREGAERRLSDTGEVVTSASGAVEAAKTSYEQECKRLGLCEKCPFVEDKHG